MKKTLLIMALSFGLNAYGQSEIMWQKRFGGSGEDYATALDKTADGGVIIAGYSSSTDGHITENKGASDYWLVKLNGAGTMQWQKTLGGSGNDEAQSVQQTTDGGYIIAGYSTSNNGDVSGNNGAYDFWVAKTNSTGTIQWQKSIGAAGPQKAYSIKQTPDGGYIVGGTNGQDIQVVKLSTTGTLQWQKTYGGTSSETFGEINNTNDGGYIFAAYTASNNGDVTIQHGQGDAWVVKLNNFGTIQWQKTLGGTKMDLANSIIQTTDGGYIVAGYSYSNDGDLTGHYGTTESSDVWLVKLNASGTIQWQKNYGGSDLDMAHSVKKTSDGGYIVAGYTGSNDNDVSGLNNPFGLTDMWVFKTDVLGNLEWQKTLGGTNGDIAYDVVQSSDGNYIVTGHTGSPISGNITEASLGGSDVWIVKLDASILDVNDIDTRVTLNIYPNPTSELVFVESKNTITALELYDTQGKQLKTQKANGKKEQLNLSSYPQGVYMLKITTNNGDKTVKIIKK